jgi:BON domain
VKVPGFPAPLPVENDTTMLLARFALKPVSFESDWACARSWIGVIAGFLVLTSMVAAAAAPEAVLADCRLAIRAREALLQDASLRELNLGVSVHNHVATLWGPVPSKPLSRRAVDCVRRVPGVADVVNRLVVESPRDPLVEFLKSAPAKPQAGGITSPAKLTRQEPKLIPELIWHPVNRGEVTKIAPAPAPKKPIAVMPAIPLSTPAPTDDLASAIERLRQENVRLGGIRLEWSGRALHLRGTVTAWPDVYDFAKAVAQFPGVERVILDGVRLDPNSALR